MRDELLKLDVEFRETVNLSRELLDVRQGAVEGRIQNARDRLTRTYLSILFVGGTQVGKSTLLNALAGYEISRTGEGAATTKNAVFYAPADVTEGDLPFRNDIDVRVAHQGPALSSKVLIDAPDCDSFMAENKQRSQELLRSADVVLVVTSWEKYNQLSLKLLLSPEIQGRVAGSLIFVLNKLDDLPRAEESRVVDHFRSLLEGQGIKAPEIFTLSALRGFEERTGVRPAGEWLGRLTALETHLEARLDRKLKDSNWAHEVSSGLDHLVGGPSSAQTLAGLEAFLAAADSAETQLRESLRQAVREVLDAHEAALRVTVRGIVGEKMSGGFGTYLAALTYLRPSRLVSLIPLPGRSSPEDALLDGVASSLSTRLSHRLVDGLSTYMRRIRSAAKDLREQVPLADTARRDLDQVGAEPTLAPEVLFKRLRPALDPLAGVQVPGWVAGLFNLPSFVLLHAGLAILIYQYFTNLDPSRAILWLLTLPCVMISVLELQRMVYETLWLGRQLGGRMTELTTSLEEKLMESVTEGALAAPRSTQKTIRTLLDRYRGLRLRLVQFERQDVH